MVVVNDLWSAGEVMKPLVRVVAAMASQGSAASQGIAVLCRVCWAAAAAGAQSSIPIHPEHHSPPRLFPPLGFNRDVCACLLEIAICVRYTCKSRLLLDRMEKICLIGLYSPNFTERAC